MFGRLLGFLGPIWLQIRPDQSRGSRYQLAAVVVNLTGTPSSTPASRNYVLPGASGVCGTLNVREVYLQVEPAVELLRRIRSGELSRALLVWIPLMQTDDPLGIIVQWVEPASSEPDEKLRAEYGALAKVFAKLSSAKDEWLQALEGWNVKTSPFLDEIRAEGEVEGQAKAILRLLQVRFKVIPSAEIVNRIRQPHLEGSATSRAADILQLLQIRFKVTPDSEVVNRLRRTLDLDRLAHWFYTTATVNSYEEFLAEFTRE